MKTPRLVFVLVLGSSFVCGSSRAGGESESKDRATLVAEAEAEAKRLFAEDHYIFVTPKGRVDPAAGGIPAFALRERHWDVYRGKQHISEYRLLRALARVEDARRARRRKLGLGVATVVCAMIAGVSASQVDLFDGDPGMDVIGTIGFVGGFAAAIYGQTRFAMKLLPLEDLFFDVQRLNDEIREAIRAQVRLSHGVPLPAPPGPAGRPGE